ncbi:MAG: hypothetical protein FWC98_05620 [Bacteroidales bacterium]|nr:hypothetical protein [Bacteroidales bacterium]
MKNNPTHKTQANFLKLNPFVLFRRRNDPEPQPVLFWSMLVLVVIVLVFVGFVAYRKFLK